MTRTTLDLDPTVTRELRQRAKRAGKSMGQVASEALAVVFAETSADLPPFEWISHDLGQPYIDLEDKDALWANLDEPSS